MKNKKAIYIITSIVIIFLIVVGFFILKDKVLLDFSLDSLRNWIDGRPFTELFFVLFWSVRLVVVIPGVTLMILGGLIFSPMEAFFLSLIGIVLSDSIVFFLAKSNILRSLREKVTNKHPYLIDLIESYNYKILAVGVLCPVAPTDVIVFLSSYIGMSYTKFLIIFISANLPALFLYSYLGESFEGSIYNTVFIVITLVISGVLSIRLWNDLKGKLVHQN